MVNAVVEFNKFESEWATSHGNENKSSEQYHLLMKLLSENKMKDNIYFSLIEMMNRALAIVQLLTNSKPDHFTAQMEEGTLDMRTFIEVEIVGSKWPHVTKNNAAIDNVFKPESKHYAMLDNEVDVTIFYANNPDVDAKNLLRAFGTRSKYISNAKINFARQPATSHIAK